MTISPVRAARSLLLVCAVCVVGPAAALAQGTTATLKGRVLDTDGVGLPGVPVTVSSRTHGDSKKTVMTDTAGSFKFPLLSPAGDYVLAVNYPGFAPTEVGPIDLDPGKTTIQDITLRTQDELTQRVEVVAHGSIVDTESTKTSTTFNTEFIEGLPIIGRNYQDILTLTPGVTDTDGDGNPNVQGARETGLQYRLDGGNITDPASGTFGQTLNLDAIEEIEVITAGASAEYGRADGGFANIITKSGGNDFEGSFKLFWRGKILDGDGAGENQDTFFSFDRLENDLRRTSPYLTVGGALKQDRLWYFASVQHLDRVDPLNLAGATITQEVRGRNSFAKLTWQVNSDNKVALQYNDDPYEYEGFFLDFGTEQESDAVFRKGGRTPQLKWSSIVSPTLLLETLFTSYDAGQAITPISERFHPTEIEQRVLRFGSSVTLQAVYPTRECSRDGTARGFIVNCDPTKGDPAIYQIDLVNGTTTGPYPTETDDARLRNSIKADLTYTVEDAWGEHQIKSGMEFADEKFRDRPTNNPLFLNNYQSCRFCRGPAGDVVPDAVEGFQILIVPSPVQLQQTAVSFNSSAYLTDTWKPRANLALQIGLRIDREDVDTSGFTFFDPREEKRRSIGIVEGLCADALRVAQSGGGGNANQVCGVRGRIPGQFAAGQGTLIYTLDQNTPEWIRLLDVDENGQFHGGVDGPVWLDPFTRFPDRRSENFQITNLNLSPRFSASWDPWADGRTKVFGTWGRYFDRLFLDTIRFEMGPDSVNYVFVPDSTTFHFEPGMISQNTSAVSVHQVDRGIRTPFTDAFTFGVERELAPEWSARLTYTQKLAWNLLQDVDFNHLLCTQHFPELGVHPSHVCTQFLDTQGRPHLSDDLFGTVGQKAPNKAPDLYNVNPNFNQVLRIGNFNASKYRSLALEISKRLHRNWQMQASYTYSRAFGNAEEFLSALGDDPSTTDDERGYLDYDQRHRVVLILVAHMPRDIELGGTILWEGGTPFSVTSLVADEDDRGNVAFRTFFPTHQRNDQRNGNFWGLDAKAVKRFTVSKVQASAELLVQNLMNMDDATLSAYRLSSFDGVRLQEGPQGLRRFGRIWELGVTFNF